jgi:hypothetical protein
MIAIAATRSIGEAQAMQLPASSGGFSRRRPAGVLLGRPIHNAPISGFGRALALARLSKP